MKTEVIIVGAGPLGRETLGWLEDAMGAGSSHEFIGFLDPDERALDGSDVAAPILGTEETWRPKPDERFLLALGDPALRAAAAGTIRDRGGRLLTLVHPTAYVSPRAELEEGCVLAPFSVVSSSTVIGAGTLINFHASAAHDVIVGASCVLCPYATLNGGVLLGDRVFVGSHATVAPGVRVADDARIGACSLAARHVEPETLIVGVPGRPFPVERSA